MRFKRKRNARQPRVAVARARDKGRRYHAKERRGRTERRRHAHVPTKKHTCAVRCVSLAHRRRTRPSARLLSVFTPCLCVSLCVSFHSLVHSSIKMFFFCLLSSLCRVSLLPLLAHVHAYLCACVCVHVCISICTDGHPYRHGADSRRSVWPCMRACEIRGWCWWEGDQVPDATVGA